MSVWQPIETIPRDGSWFVICRSGEPDSCEAGCYEPMMWDTYIPVEGGLYRKHQEAIHEWSHINNFHRATHWMPLPPVPAA